MRNTTSWFTPYILNPHNINTVVDQNVPGVYVLGYIGPNKKFKVKHIKSSDNVREELMQHLGKFQVFMYKPFRNLFNPERAGQQPLRLKFS